MSGFWQLSFELGARDPNSAEESCFELGATSVTYVDAHDDPVLEPLPGEFRLWPTTRLRALFADGTDPQEIARALTGALGIPPDGVQTERIEDRVWEREWLRDFHAMRFGRRLWICPHHEQVTETGCRGRSDGPGTGVWNGHPSHHGAVSRVAGPPYCCGQRLIDFGCGSGVLAIAALKLGACEAHCFDIDPQALTATRENAAANGVQSRLTVYETAAGLPRGRGRSRREYSVGSALRARPDFRVARARRWLNSACGTAGTRGCRRDTGLRRVV